MPELSEVLRSASTLIRAEGGFRPMRFDLAVDPDELDEVAKSGDDPGLE